MGKIQINQVCEILCFTLTNLLREVCVPPAWTLRGVRECKIHGGDEIFYWRILICKLHECVCTNRLRTMRTSLCRSFSEGSPVLLQGVYVQEIICKNAALLLTETLIMGKTIDLFPALCFVCEAYRGLTKGTSPPGGLHHHVAFDFVI